LTPPKNGYQSGSQIGSQSGPQSDSQSGSQSGSKNIMAKPSGGPVPLWGTAGCQRHPGQGLAKHSRPPD